MSGLITWFRAQMDEDERVVRAAAAATEPAGHRYERYAMAVSHQGFGHTEEPVPYIAMDGTAATMDHIARFNPKRELDEIEAKRRIVDLHASDGGHECPESDDAWGSVTGYEQHCLTLRLLAVPYADRDGYDESWRP